MNVKVKYNRQTPCVYDNIKVMFHGIPKNASTSIKNILYEANWGKPFTGNKQWIHKGNEKGGSIYPPEEIIASKIYSTYTHFTVVRDPYTRFISFYSDLFLKSTNIRHNVPPFYVENNITLDKKPVDEVIEIVCSYEDHESDEHFASQSSFIYVDNIQYLKQENLSTAWKDFSANIGIAYTELPVYNKSNSKVLLTEDQKIKLYKRYEEDFERFKYER